MMASPSRRPDAGFTLVETVVTLVLVLFAIYGLHATLTSSIRGRVATQQLDRVHRLATDMVARIRRLPFGTVSDPTPAAEDLDELFDADDDLGSITLQQLRVLPTQPGWTFTVATDGMTGQFRVKVSRDLDRDGLVTGWREGRDDILGVEIWYDGRLVMATSRAADPSFTTIDTHASY
jgi:Tfp pilus assembly protein PilV